MEGANNMEMELIMLGTGSAMVTKCYNTCFALRNNNEYFLVDGGGGNGIMVQLQKADIDYQNIHHIFVTHGHTDHILGIIWVIRKCAMLMKENKYLGELTIYCHDEAAKMLNTFCEMMFPKRLLPFIGNGIFIREVKSGERFNAIGMEIQFFDIQSTKAKQFGFKAILPNGKSLACLGDEPYTEVSKDYVENSDFMLTEAFCLYEDREIFKPYEKNHNTALDTGKLAKQLNVKNLVIYHTEDKNLEKRKKLYTEEAKSVYSGQVFVPDDLERIQLK